MTDALEGERTLSMPFNALTSIHGPSSWEGGNNWTRPAGTSILYTEAYFDCSAYMRDGLTLFPIGVTIQDPGRYLSSNANVPMQVLDIVSQVRLDPTEVFNNLGNGSVPGMSGTTDDWTQIIWGQYRTLLGQASFQSAGTEFLTASAGLFGSGAPTTAEKLWVYRFVVLPGAVESDHLTLPASRIIMSAVVAEEKELAFLMRQKRSYELAT